tara:strand:+ start:7378 stop:8175 length:798 start_codon:yes stop_codon:yes gene_type:complete
MKYFNAVRDHLKKSASQPSNQGTPGANQAQAQSNAMGSGLGRGGASMFQAAQPQQVPTPPAAPAAKPPVQDVMQNSGAPNPYLKNFGSQIMGMTQPSQQSGSSTSPMDAVKGGLSSLMQYGSPLAHTAINQVAVPAIQNTKNYLFNSPRGSLERVKSVGNIAGKMLTQGNPILRTIESSLPNQDSGFESGGPAMWEQMNKPRPHSPGFQNRNLLEQFDMPNMFQTGGPMLRELNKPRPHSPGFQNRDLREEMGKHLPMGMFQAGR